MSSVGLSVVSCCGVVLPSLIVEEADDNHSMTKRDYISFIAYATSDKLEIKKLYPEQNVEASFLKSDRGIIYAYCNKDGLYKKKF